MFSTPPRPRRRLLALALGAALTAPMMMLAAAPLSAEAGSPLALIAPSPAHAADATLTGSVTEMDSPVSRALVSAYRWDAASESFVFEQDTESLADGTWELSFLPDGAYTLQFDTAASSAQFALGESLGGNASYTADTPTIEITDGTVTSAGVTQFAFTRLGGAVTLAVTRDSEALNDLDDAVAELRGVNASGEAVTSRRYFASEDGTLTIARVPAGGFIPWLGANGSALAPSTADLLVAAGKVADAGKLELGEAPTDAVTGAAPALSGEARVGGELSVAVEVTPASDLSYRWSTASGVALKATEASLKLDDKLEGERVRAWVFARAADAAPFVGVAVSEPVAPADSQADSQGGAQTEAQADNQSDNSTSDASSAGKADATASATAAAKADAGGSNSGADAGSASASANGDEAPGDLASTGAAALPWLGGIAAVLLLVGAALFVRKRAARDSGHETVGTN